MTNNKGVVSKKKHFPFLHKYKLVGIQHWRDADLTGGDFTEVRKRCFCGKLKMSKVKGHWTMKELT
jgi:hypothetical protein